VNARTVWLASYPKSGNTWLRALLTAWDTGSPPRLDALVGRGVAAREPLDDALGIPSSDLTPAEVAILRPRVDELLAEAREDTLLRKTHDGLYPGPEGEPVISVQATRSAVYMIRDPRDVAVSLAHHDGRDVEWVVDHLDDANATRAGTAGALDYQVDQRTGRWSDHVRSWVDDAPFPVHVVRYEDCVDDPVGVFGAALRFIQLESVDDADVSLAVERASFDHLRAEESREGFAERPRRATLFFRHGRAGAWRDEMTTEAAARIEQAHGEVMARFGYL
jgi:aryl sulfotransferase